MKNITKRKIQWYIEDRLPKVWFPLAIGVCTFMFYIYYMRNMYS